MSESTYSLQSDSVVVLFEDNTVSMTLRQETLDYNNLEVLLNTAERVRDDREVRAFALTISGNGYDPDNMGDIPERFKHRVPSGSHGPGPIVEQAVVQALYNITKPTIAFLGDRINGFGIDLASVCDIRVATESTTLQDTRIQQGRTASSGVTYLLPKLIGQSQAMRILLLGDELDAQEMNRIHFVHKLVPDEDYVAFQTAFSKQVGRMATRAWEVHKMQVLGQLHLDFNAAMIHSLGIRQTHVINDRLEGMRAWRERRDPEFSGN